jgi:hypothetical protein
MYSVLAFICVFLGLPNNTWAFLWQGITKVHVICLLVVITSRFKVRNMVNGGVSLQFSSRVLVPLFIQAFS